jgi:hypothetical protein
MSARACRNPLRHRAQIPSQADDTLLPRRHAVRYPVTGPRDPPGTTIALTRTGERSFRAVHKDRGKVWLEISYGISPDGQHLTTSARTQAASQATTVVYDRQ